jgi:hypothetical protein
MPSLTQLARRAAPLVLTLGAVTGCGDSTGTSDSLFTIRGTITNPSGQPIPSRARVVVAWVVSAASPDYTYIYGEGTVQGGSFRLTFTQPPPAAAVNAGEIGVGVVLLTTSTALRSGVHLEDAAVAEGELLGATARYAVIYKAADTVTLVDWADAFPLGFSAGSGVERPGEFDAFTPSSPTSMELIVGDLDQIDIVNWT